VRRDDELSRLFPPMRSVYTRRDRDVLAGVGGFLLGLILAFASCSAPEVHQTYSPTTEQGISR
jgi:hypothetical protein